MAFIIHHFQIFTGLPEREWFEVWRNRQVTIRRETFLEGGLFEGSFWRAPGWYGTHSYEFQIRSVKLRIGRYNIDRLFKDTIRVTCELLPPGTEHPNRAVYTDTRTRVTK